MCKLVSLNTNYGAEIQVADIKKTFIDNIIELAPLCKQISEIILFGSALEEKCTDKSDIDIAIISNLTINALCKNKGFSKFIEAVYNIDLSQDYDRVYFTSIEEIEKKQEVAPICKELLQKGKIIYRRT